MRVHGLAPGRAALSRRLAVALAAAVCCAPRTAHAELTDDVAHVVAAWRASGATVRPLGAYFVFGGESRPFQLAPPPLEPGGGLAAAQPACTTVLALAERHVELALGPVLAPGMRERQDAVLERSEAGVATLTACGPLRDALRAVRVDMGSLRATVELVVAHHQARLPAVHELVSARARGPVAPQGDVGLPLRPGALADRVARAEDGARLDGAEVVHEVRTQASPQGGGALVLRLREGCHRVVVVGAVDSASHPDGDAVDIDAEVRERFAREPLVRDRSHAPEARMDFCVGADEPVELRYLGAVPDGEVVVLDARWPIPAAVPHAWGSQARGGLAWALHRRRAPVPAGAPTVEVLGGVGVTALPVEVDPSACYLAAVALSHGDASAGRLSAEVGSRSYHDDATDPPRGAAVTFCAQGATLARLGVDLRGRSATWALALWRLTP